MRGARMSTVALIRCKRCGTPYHFSKSTASLKLTYCNALCERADLGFTIEALLKAQRDA